MNAKKAEKISKALGDPNRLIIIQEIRKKGDPLYCCDIDNVLNLAQPSICHHMKLLTDTEIVISEKQGRNVRYTLNDKLLDEYIDFLKCLKKD
ncbi:ArsR/SmtB family transcription factor [Chryseosolibacter indicus]|uniref:ArsR family transcriptional regulator n=1 Tax=Chryseosolibacter indicus TaxID=2782351 RepID=A0ABS5VR94_9BACT|nr:metalloregulator ArsR/SmtB family transcription factor [Chryseosolibacter indicus]MBT1703676.1 ArsR family transcriptional regulator [Chryseosolibacter indicus]